MEELRPTPKAIAAKKFIENFYTEYDIKEVKFTLYTKDIPMITVYFNQQTNAANENQVFQHQIIGDLRHYLSIRANPPFLLSWEVRKDIYQKPDVRISKESLNEPV